MPHDIASDAPRSLEILGPCPDPYRAILTLEALDFVADLVRRFRPRVDALLAHRREVQARIDRGILPDFLETTAEVRASDWTIAPMPADLEDRRVEITGPVDRKMIINALNSGANVFMADLEDSSSPTWANMIEGQINLRDAVVGTIRYEHPRTGKIYSLGERVATLMVRPRGWHLEEAHLRVDGRPAPAGLVDFGLFFFHNARALVERGTGPYFYLPKLESHLGARLWNDVFVHAQAALGLPQGTIKATVLLETLLAAFEMDEILWELRAHSAGLNCGRWDYIFSVIKKLQSHAGRVLPDRAQVGMTQPFMRAYTSLVVKTCHRRGAHAMGGMAAQIPIKSDSEANTAALEKVRQDKLREVLDGHDGTWVAHPGLVPLAREIFDAHMTGPHQRHITREDVEVTASDLLAVPDGTQTLDGVRLNARVGIAYLEAWLCGNGCVPLNHLMEDAATAEISRVQLWQWIHHGAVLESGEAVTAALVSEVIDDETRSLEAAVDSDIRPDRRFGLARELFLAQCTAPSCDEFLTLPAYEHLVVHSASQA